MLNKIRTSVLIIFFVGCSYESAYNGGSGAFKSYESYEEYNSNITKKNYKNQTLNSRYGGFESSLIEPDNFFLDRSGGSSYMKSENNSYNNASEYDGVPVEGSGNFDRNDSLMRGMRDSAAIQRATMRPYKIAGKMYYPTKVKVGDTMDGIASWYGPDFHSKATSNGEKYNMHSHTAASKTLPINTIVKVFNKDNSKTTIVRINDRGPFVEGRIIDLSNIAAKDIDMVTKGTANVRLEIIGFGGVISKQNENSLSAEQKENIKNEIKVGDSKQNVIETEYILVLNAFSKKEGANNFKQKSEELTQNTKYKLNIIQTNKLYRVIIEGFKSEGEAVDFRDEKNIAAQVLLKN